MIVLDTHALIWVDRGDAALGPIARGLINGGTTTRLS